MKLHPEKTRRPEKVLAKSALREGEPELIDLPFDPKRDITTAQREGMLKNTENHDCSALAVALNEATFGTTPKNDEEIQFLARAWGSFMSKSDEKFVESMSVYLTNEPKALLFSITILQKKLPPEVCERAIRLLWGNQKIKPDGTAYSLMILYGAQQLLKDHAAEVADYESAMKAKIPAILAQLPHVGSVTPWQRRFFLLDLTLLSLTFPELKTQIVDGLPPQIWEKIKADIQTATDNYETLHASELAFSGMVLAKIQPERLNTGAPLPTRAAY